tara:strand:+ start:801 stop:1037 length:237 start_codon:yes stop_codon:yes gene_type:complete
MEGGTIIFFITVLLALVIRFIFVFDSLRIKSRHLEIIKEYALILNIHHLKSKKRIAKLAVYDFQKYNLNDALNIQNFE